MSGPRAAVVAAVLLVATCAAACGGEDGAVAVGDASDVSTPGTVAESLRVPASAGALEFVRKVLAGEDVGAHLVDERASYDGLRLGPPYVPAPDIPLRVIAATRPLVGIRAVPRNAAVLRLRTSGELREQPYPASAGFGPGCGFPGDVHVACSIVLDTPGADGEVVVWMLSRRTFPNRPPSDPVWLVDLIEITVPVLPFTG